MIRFSHSLDQILFFIRGEESSPHSSEAIPAYDSQLKQHYCSTMSANKKQANTGVDGAELGEA